MPQSRRVAELEATIAEQGRQIKAMQAAFTESATVDEVRDRLEELSDDTALTYADVKAMSAADVNAHWDEVSAVLERGPDADRERWQTDTDTTGSGASGRQLNEHTGAPTALSRESISAMSPDEVIRRKPEIDAWLAGGGR